MSASPNLKPALALLASKCSANIFDISTGVRSASIRDQVVRAQLLVRGLCSDPKFQRLLVVGAGVAGVAAGMAARAANKEVLVVETHSEPLALQARCRWRYVGPFMYEWPSCFFDDQSYPPKGLHWPDAPDSTLRWTGRDPLLASDFAAQVQAWLRSHKAPARIVTTVNGSEVTTYVQGFSQSLEDAHHTHSAWRAPTLQLSQGQDWPTGTQAAPLAFTPDYIVLAAGMGDEGVDLLDAKGTKLGISGKSFWLADDGLRAPGAQNAAIAIFGGGDGALQDVLRALTRFEHPLPMWRFLRAEPQLAQGLRSLLGWPGGLKCRRLLDAALPQLDAMEQQNRLTAVWVPGEPELIRTVDEACRQLATELATHRCIRHRVSLCMREGSGEVRHYVRESHFGKAYLLNRFLVHLIQACQRASGTWTGRMHYELTWKAQAQAQGPGLKGRRYSITTVTENGLTDAQDFDHLAVRFGPRNAPARQMLTLSAVNLADRTSLEGLVLPFVAPQP